LKLSQAWEEMMMSSLQYHMSLTEAAEAAEAVEATEAMEDSEDSLAVEVGSQVLMRKDG
jgi:hypothetical protein